MSNTLKDFKYSINENTVVAGLRKRTKRIGYSFRDKTGYQRREKYGQSWRQES